jgi:hypothetical protein
MGRYIRIDVNDSSRDFRAINTEPRRERDHTFLFSLAGEIVEVTSDPDEATNRLSALSDAQKTNLERSYLRAFDKQFDWNEYDVSPPPSSRCGAPEPEGKPFDWQGTSIRTDRLRGSASEEPEITLVLDDVYKLGAALGKSKAFVVVGQTVTLVEYQAVVMGAASPEQTVVWAGKQSDRIGVYADGRLVADQCEVALKGRSALAAHFLEAYRQAFGKSTHAERETKLITQTAGLHPAP